MPRPRPWPLRGATSRMRQSRHPAGWVGRVRIAIREIGYPELPIQQPAPDVEGVVEPDERGHGDGDTGQPGIGMAWHGAPCRGSGKGGGGIRRGTPFASVPPAGRHTPHPQGG